MSEWPPAQYAAMQESFWGLVVMLVWTAGMFSVAGLWTTEVQPSPSIIGLVKCLLMVLYITPVDKL